MFKGIIWIVGIWIIMMGAYFAYDSLSQKKWEDSLIVGNMLIPIALSGAEATPTDYAKREHWLVVPENPDKKVDVFYLYPTAWQKKPTDGIVNTIDNPSMIQGAKLVFERQATAFDTVGNIYAPFYRQDDAASTLSLPLEEQQKIVAGIPTMDAVAAFDYYIKHYNNGRPFVLASHSQGSNVMIYLLSGYMKEHPEVYQRMIAAYVIGYSVTGEYLARNPHLKFAEGPDDTGVIISYNTEAPSIPGKNPVVLPGALVINPITWTRESTLAPADKNLGSLLLDTRGLPVRDGSGQILSTKWYADAQIDAQKGVLICSTLDQSTLVLGFGPGIFHSYDYPLYYFNIRENAENRVRRFLEKK